MKVLETVLKTLQDENIIVIEELLYFFNASIDSEVLKLLKNKKRTVIELSQIIKNNIKSSVLKNEGNCFKYKKMYLDSDQEKILNILLYNVESFLDSVLKTKKKGATSQERIVFWGQNSYEQTVSNFLPDA